MTTPVLASQWGLLPSRGTEAHSVLLLKASLAPCGRVGEGSGGLLFWGLVWSPLHTTLRPKRSGQSRKDGDEDVEDFTPGGIVVESSHSVKCFSGLDIKVYYQDPPVWRLHFVTLPCREGRGGSLFRLQRYNIKKAVCKLMKTTENYCKLTRDKVLIMRG